MMQREMYQDVEIIEVDNQIIEISDDDCIQEEDIKDVLLINNIATALFEDNDINIHIRTPAEVVHATHSLNTEDQCINSEDQILEPVSNRNDSIVAPAKNSQVNEISPHKNCNTNIQNTSLVGNITTGNNSNVALSKNQAKKRKRNRRKQNNKNAQNSSITKILRKASIEKELNISNNIDQNKNNSTVLETATCSSNSMTAPTCNTEKSNNYDYSKLKWLKPVNSLSSPPHLQIVIIDRTHPFWRIDTEKWLMIEKRLLEALNSEMIRTNDASIGLFDGAKWQRGVKVIGCHNKNAFDFIMKFIINLDKLWCGAKLDAFPLSNITRHLVKVYIPPPTLKTEVVMSLIKLQNSSICTKDWKVVKERERSNNGGIDIWICVNDESITQLCRLGGEIKYGINRIFVNPSY